MPAKKSIRAQKLTAPVQNNLIQKLPSSKIYIILVVLILAAALFYFKSLFIVAIVNGQPVSRLSVISELEKQGGKRTLENIVTKMLVLQEAQKQHVTVSQDEINSELKKIEDSLSKQGQNLNETLAMQGMTKNDLTEQISLQKLVEKMVGKDVKVSDKEINDYIEQNKETLGENLNLEKTKQQVAEQLKQKKLSEKAQSWLINLQQKAKISYFINY